MKTKSMKTYEFTFGTFHDSHTTGNVTYKRFRARYLVEAISIAEQWWMNHADIGELVRIQRVK